MVVALHLAVVVSLLKNQEESPNKAPGDGFSTLPVPFMVCYYNRIKSPRMHDYMCPFNE